MSELLKEMSAIYERTFRADGSAKTGERAMGAALEWLAANVSDEQGEAAFDAYFHGVGGDGGWTGVNRLADFDPTDQKRMRDAMKRAVSAAVTSAAVGAVGR